MTYKTKYLISNILDFVFTFGGSALIVGINYVSKSTSKYKLAITGIMMIIALVFTAKHIFEKGYRDKMDMYLQALASTNNTEEKQQIEKEIDSLKMKNNIYNRILIILPFAILYIVAYMGEKELYQLRSTTGLMMTTLGIGSIFNVIKQPMYEKMKIENIRKKVLKKSIN